MEIQFSKNTLDYLRQVVWDTKQMEQTQEVKLPDAMPDIGSVLAAWGQPVLRGKSWHGNAMTANGGVAAWILYAPEDGTPPQVVETWLPYQIRWEFPPTQHDGTMLIHTALQALDARSVSPRKLIVRGVISALGEALEPVRQEYPLPMELPDTVEVLRQSYPLMLAKEAGEKAFDLEEKLSLPARCRDAASLLYYRLQPRIAEKKVLGDKAVFRGTMALWGLCRCADDSISPFQMEVPFSQYAELQSDYSEAAQLFILPALTNAELELGDEGTVQLKAGMVSQYVICDRTVLETVEDAYGLGMEIEANWEPLELPVILEQRRDTLRAQQKMDVEAGSVLDAAFYLGEGHQMKDVDAVTMHQPGSFQLLYTDAEGIARSATAGWEGELSWNAAADSTMLSYADEAGMPTAECQPGSAETYADIQIHTRTVTAQKIPMLTELKLGAQKEKDPNRPSLILRKVGDDSLWQIAKQSGYRMEDIRKANPEQTEILPDTVLLIPVP